MKIITQRIYAERPQKGYRVLVDRLWPRGVSKEDALLDNWCKDIAPSSELRKWFNHEAGKWTEFRRKYLHELEDNKNKAEELIAEASKAKAPLVLLYGARSEIYNQAIVLKEFLEKL